MISGRSFIYISTQQLRGGLGDSEMDFPTLLKCMGNNDAVVLNVSTMGTTEQVFSGLAKAAKLWYSLPWCRYLILMDISKIHEFARTVTYQ